MTRSGDQWSGLCPAHDDTRASLSFRDAADRVLVNCHKGCSFEAIAAAMGLMPSDFIHTNGRRSSPPANAGTTAAKARPRVIAKTYDYRDENGKLLFQVVRWEPKDFSQRQPDGHGGWIKNIKGVRRVVYRMPVIIDVMNRRALGERVVVVVEGEKDCDSLWDLGIPATTNAMGAKKWTDDCTRQLVAAGVKGVVIIPDNDKDGEEHARMVARSCRTAGLRVKITKLANQPEKGDISDWIHAGNGREALLEAFGVTQEWTEADLGPAGAAASTPIRGHNRPASPASFHKTDLGNAERLDAKFGKDIRYANEVGWLVWDHRRWGPDPGACEVMKYAGQTVRSMYAEAAELDDDGARQELVKHAKQSEARARLEAMVALAKPHALARLSHFDRDPYLLNVENGTIDLRTGALRPHQRLDLITKLAPVTFDAAAEAPIWNRFLKEIMNGNEALVRFLQRSVGYSLTGATSEQVLFILFGTGANGKSTLLTIISEALGDYAMQTPTETLLAKRQGAIPNDVARLVGARFVTAVEVSDGRRLDEALVKQVTGGDSISARFLHREFFQFTPEFKLFLAVNHKPQVRGTDEAIWRRIRLIPFEVTIPEDQRDKKLLEKLRRELPGVLAWAVQGCLAWQQEGLRVPGEVRAATEAYRSEEDRIAQFLDECCLAGHRLKVRSADLYKAYTEWCENAGEDPVSQKKLGSQLSERGFVVRKSGGTKIWSGLGLLVDDRRESHGDERDDQDVGSGSSRIANTSDQTLGKGPDHPHGPDPRRKRGDVAA